MNNYRYVLLAAVSALSVGQPVSLSSYDVQLGIPLPYNKHLLKKTGACDNLNMLRENKVRRNRKKLHLTKWENSMQNNVNLLSGKVAVITGAGRGIGKAIALAFANIGASIVCAARTEKEIKEVAEEIQKKGGQALAIPTDVTDLESVYAMLKKTNEDFGRIDILVVNAGINADRNLVEKSNPDGWFQTINVNLIGAYNCAHSVIPYMKQKGGKIITIGSGLGHRGNQGGSAYACSKAGLWMLTRILAEELWQYKISVNELIPGPVTTSMDNNSKASVFDIESEWIKEPKDVIPLAIFLATQPEIGPTAQSFSLMRRDN
ncbi:SDR family NAD(P)-dependent oxidoreductase [Sporolactobacillus pectinivorans]|uniref:SDR family NAD(P)-dependent oxidoreductase n=1 Tax=Sporolactobacillus pectinivorans TaxID=1591408 RepID=UPI00195F7156|nr:SDR family NAD(P)-dependent oxidoreductase [Sporolactobacillus pectinivorans]